MNCKLSDHMLPAPVGGGIAMEDYWVWCGSVVKGEDGRYHMFASRWPKKFPMHPGWLVASEIVRASCDTPDGTYQFEEVVLPERGPQYWDGRMTHDPHIRKIGDKYVLYYLGTTHPFNDPDANLSLEDPRVLVARSNKRIGIAVADSVFGPWKRFDKPLITTRPDKFDNFMVTDAAPCVMPDGRMLVVYKSSPYQKEKPYTGMSVHVRFQHLGAAIADRYDGDFTITRTDEPLTTEFHMEDPFVWHDEDGYNMMVKDMDGRLCGETLSQNASASFGADRGGVTAQLLSVTNAIDATYTPNGTVVDTISDELVYDPVAGRHFVEVRFTDKNGQEKTGWIASSILGMKR